ncbi:MAG: hypothetical protein GY847_30810 [Proteobacteria bacterium]|nr:hypothetical protein [Pseudomonadota bacterium]
MNTNKEMPILSYIIDATYFYDRAKNALDEFDKSKDVSQILYAALHMRYAIEARLYEYIEAEQGLVKRNKKIDTHAASKLLKRLVEINPQAGEGGTLTMESETHRVSFQYTPITRKLAKYHGRLGEMLHFKFFKNNPDWFIYAIPKNGKVKTIKVYRQMLDEIMVELKTALSGTMLTHPQIGKLLKEISDENEQGN